MRYDLRLRAARLCAVLLLGWVATGCTEKVDSRYPDLHAARAAGLFERGWLPDLLPPSSTGIRVANDLDGNTSEGEFAFAPGDYPAFAGRMRALRTAPGGKPGLLRHAEGRAVWIFDCDARRGHCSYSMKPLSP